jgi:hypothetical protein
MLSCDCNGWNDTPEDEREALDAYEAAAEKGKGRLGEGLGPRDYEARVAMGRGRKALRAA